MKEDDFYGILSLPPIQLANVAHDATEDFVRPRLCLPPILPRLLALLCHPHSRQHSSRGQGGAVFRRISLYPRFQSRGFWTDSCGALRYTPFCMSHLGRRTRATDPEVVPKDAHQVGRDLCIEGCVYRAPSLYGLRAGS